MQCHISSLHDNRLGRGENESANFHRSIWLCGQGIKYVIPIALAPSKCLLNSPLLDLEDSGPLILIDGYAETK